MQEKERKNKKYSPEFKISVILDMRENYLSQRETIRKYWNTSCRAEENLYISTLKSWKRIFLKEGAEGLMIDRRKCSTDDKTRGKPIKSKKQTKEELIDENQRLRVENEYLKKLNALVQERIKRENPKKLK